MDHFDDITCEEYYGPEITDEDMEGLYDLTDEEIADLKRALNEDDEW